MIQSTFPCAVGQVTQPLTTSMALSGAPYQEAEDEAPWAESSADTCDYSTVEAAV